MKSTKNAAWVVISVGVFFSACSGSSESSRVNSSPPSSSHRAPVSSQAPHGPSCDESVGHLVTLGEDRYRSSNGTLDAKEYLVQSCEMLDWSKTLRECIFKSSTMQDTDRCGVAAQSFKAGMEIVCRTPVQVKTTDESRRNEMMANYIGRRLINPEVITSFWKIGMMSPADKRETVQKLADRAGISPCPMAELSWE